MTGGGIYERHHLQRNGEPYNEYRQLIDGMNDAVFIHDLEGNFLAVNDTAVERLGYARDVLLSMRPQDIDLAKKIDAQKNI